MKKPLWIVQTTLLEKTLSAKMPKVIRSLGYDVIEVKRTMQHVRYLHDLVGFMDEGNGPIIAYGTHDFLKKALKEPWLPGIYPTNDSELELLKTHIYMNKYKSEDLFNSNYILVPIQELIRNKSFYYDLFESDALFIKDNEAFKRFTAKSMKPYEMVDYLTLYKDTYSISDHELVFVAPKQKIFSEHRFFIVNKKVVAHSTYQYDGILDIRIDVPESALLKAQQLAEVFQPSACFTIDIALNEEKIPKLLEINSFSAAGLYAADISEVVKAVSEQAMFDYNDALGKI